MYTVERNVGIKEKKRILCKWRYMSRNEQVGKVNSMEGQRCYGIYDLEGTRRQRQKTVDLKVLTLLIRCWLSENLREVATRPFCIFFIISYDTNSYRSIHFTLFMAVYASSLTR